MKPIRYILLFFLLLGSVGVSHSQDFARVTEHTILGTARYMGMGGAMSAVGGDPSSVHDNPAGLGLYQRSEALISLMGNIDRTQMIQDPTTVRSDFHIAVPHASLVVNVLNHNFMFSYRRLQTQARTMYGTGKNEPSLGALLANTEVNWDIAFCSDPWNKKNELYLQERGGLHEFGFNWAMSISHQWYVGAGLQIQSLRLSADAEYYESFNRQSTLGYTYYNRNRTSLIHSGIGASLSAGLLYRPAKWLRLGFGIQTPSLGTLNIYGSGTLTAQADSLGISRGPDGLLGRVPNTMLQPLHTSTSVAFQFGAYGMAAVQYDFFYQKGEYPIHSLRAGIEVIPVLGLYLNAGYACESNFRTEDRVVPMDPTFDRQDTYYQFPKMSHYASFAIGYRGQFAIVQAAYQYRWQNLHLYAHEAASPYPMHADTHRIVLTIGWHRY